MKNFVRGAAVRIALTFEDNSGAVVQPTGAKVTLSFVPIGGDGTCARTFLTYPLAADPTPGSTDWIYIWDSSIAAAYPVYAHAVTTTVGVPVSSIDFAFRLTANRANKDLAGEGMVFPGYG